MSNGKKIAIAFILFGIKRPDVGRANLRQARECLTRPSAFVRGQRFERRLEIIQNASNQPVAGPEQRL